MYLPGKLLRPGLCVAEEVTKGCQTPSPQNGVRPLAQAAS
jgi:hypothetical protein